MAVRAPGDSGYDPNTGWPSDDSTDINWDSDVDIPGQFGRGGFRFNPRLTAPASGPPPGISLSGPGGAAATGGPDVVPPTSQPLRSGVSPTVRTGPGPYTDATTPQGGGGGLFSRLSSFLPSIFGGAGPAIVPALAAGGAAAGWKYGEPGREKLSVDPRIDASSSGGFDVGQPLGAPGGPDSFSPDAGAPPPFQQPAHPSTMRYPMWPTPPAPAPSAVATPMPARPVTPTPITAYPTPTPPPRPRATPRAAGPAAVRQQPNLGAYGGPFTTIDRPNMTPQNSAIGRQGAPQMTALDLSKLFSRQQ